MFGLDTRRLLLLMIFGFSAFYLWQAWERERNPPQPQQAATAPARPARRARRDRRARDVRAGGDLGDADPGRAADRRSARGPDRQRSPPISIPPTSTPRAG